MDVPVCCDEDATTIDMNDDIFDVGSDTIGRTSGRRDGLQPAMFHMEGIDTNDGQTMMTMTIHRKTGDLSGTGKPGNFLSTGNREFF